jgi:hypothetical protein
MKRSPSAPANPEVRPILRRDRDFDRDARSGVAHLPEIVGTRDADDAGPGDAIFSRIEGLVVVDIDGGRQLVLRQAEFCDQVQANGWRGPK